MFTLWYIFLGYKELKEWIDQLKEESGSDGGRQSTRKSENKDGGDDGGDGGDEGDAGEEGGDDEGGDDDAGGDEGDDGGEEGEEEGEGGEEHTVYIGGTEAVVVEEGPVIEKGLRTVVEEDEEDAEEDTKYWTDENGKGSRTSVRSHDTSPSISIISGQDWAWSDIIRESVFASEENHQRKIQERRSMRRG